MSSKLSQFTPYKPYKDPLWLLGNCFEDKTFKKLSEEQGIHYTTLSRWLKHWNLWFPNKGKTHRNWKGGKVIKELLNKQIIKFEGGNYSTWEIQEF